MQMQAWRNVGYVCEGSIYIWFWENIYGRKSNVNKTIKFAELTKCLGNCICRVQCVRFEVRVMYGMEFVIDVQQDATFRFIYLYRISSTCFRRCFRPSSGALGCIYSFWYSPLYVDTVVVLARYVHIRSCKTVKCSWWWAKTSSETCRADWVQINKPKF